MPNDDILNLIHEAMGPSDVGPFPMLFFILHKNYTVGARKLCKKGPCKKRAFSAKNGFQLLLTDFL